MRVFSRRVIREFWEKHRDAEDQLKAWYKEAHRAKWENPSHLKANYPSASILKSGRIVFNICGNTYRMIVDVNYKRGWIFIRFIGKHSEYDRIDADNI